MKTIDGIMDGLVKKANTSQFRIHGYKNVTDDSVL